MSVPTVPLTDDLQIPLVGFGTYLIGNDDARAAVSTALEAGYRHIDTAEGYRNEVGVGAALRDSGLDRDAFFVTTKVWPGNRAWGQAVKDTAGTIAALDASLDRLGLDHVDLYLIHAPYEPTDRLAQWEGMVALHEQGKARAIGVSNFDIGHIEALADAGFPLPHANQIELHPWSQKPALVRYLTDKRIQPVAYSSLVPLASWRSAPGQHSAKTEQMRDEGTREDFPFWQMAEKYGVTEAQVLLRWGVQMGYPVLPKSTKPRRIRQNIDLFSFELDDEDMAAIATMDRGDGIAWKSGDPTKAPVRS